MKAVEILDDPPSENSAAIMDAIDAMEPEWRALVHEFGVVIVSEIMGEANTVEEGREMLNYWRSRRQEQWLATNYVTRSLFRKAA
jgi:hypothetical protein